MQDRKKKSTNCTIQQIDDRMEAFKTLYFTKNCSAFNFNQQFQMTF